VHQERLSKSLARLAGASEEEIEDPTSLVRFLRSVKAKNLSGSMWDILEEQVWHDHHQTQLKAPHQQK